MSGARLPGVAGEATLRLPKLLQRECRLPLAGAGVLQHLLDQETHGLVALRTGEATLRLLEADPLGVLLDVGADADRRLGVRQVDVVGRTGGTADRDCDEQGKETHKGLQHGIPPLFDAKSYYNTQIKKHVNPPLQVFREGYL